MSNNQILTGVVVRKRTPKTIRVAVKETNIHPIYKKRYTLTKYVTAHDESDAVVEGQTVTVQQCRPMSRTKRWQVVA